MTPVEGSLFQVCKPAFQIHSLKVVGVVGKALRRVSVNSVVRKSVMFSNVIADIAFPRRSFMFSQSGCEVFSQSHRCRRRASRSSRSYKLLPVCSLVRLGL